MIFFSFYYFLKIMLEIWGCSLSTSASYTQIFTVTATGAIHWNITMWPVLGNKMKANRLLPLSDITSLEKCLPLISLILYMKSKSI